MQGSENIVITIFLASSLIALVLVLLVVTFMIIYQRRMARQKTKIQEMEIEFQRELLRKAFESQETERKRIAKDLHDGVGAMLSTVRLLVGKLAPALPVAEGTLDLRATTFEAIDETLDTVRSISHDLLPPALERYGLAPALVSFTDRISASGKIKATCIAEENWQRLPAETEKSLFRITQELTQNSLKHANAQHIQIQLSRSHGAACFHYQDDGAGIDPRLLQNGDLSGLGLRNIETRAALIGANATWDLKKTPGMAITITFPTLLNSTP